MNEIAIQIASKTGCRNASKYAWANEGILTPSPLEIPTNFNYG